MKEKEAINDAKVPGLLLSSELAVPLQRRFVEHFVPEFLPRVAPPFWGVAFESADIVSKDYLWEDEFLSRKKVFCLVSRQPPKPVSKQERAIYLCSPIDIANMLSSLHWSVHCDFYIFDESFEWFVAALEERIYQMDEQGDYPLLVYRPLSKKDNYFFLHSNTKRNFLDTLSSK